jgi:hypothetical protein
VITFQTGNECMPVTSKDWHPTEGVVVDIHACCCCTRDHRVLTTVVGFAANTQYTSRAKAADVNTKTICCWPRTPRKTPAWTPIRSQPNTLQYVPITFGAPTPSALGPTALTASWMPPPSRALAPCRALTAPSMVEGHTQGSTVEEYRLFN